MVSAGYLVGYVAQGVGAPALGAVVTAHGLMTGLMTGAIAFGVLFLAALTVLAPLHKAERRTSRLAAASSKPCGVDARSS
ncbi:hypothetical protein ACIQUW_06340 [Streptomyces sp. NPDC101117]|uniref:hypothetical protein n=1 Tax=Streptomyces sp. NPDC101117 TaxID=3366108 RepID=UPI00381F4973